MAISKATVEARLRPYLLSRIKSDVLDAISNSTFVSIYNDVARDINSLVEIHITRYYKQCNTANAENEELTNYILERRPLKVYSLKYNDPQWRDQYWVKLADGSNNGRIVFKNSPPEGTQLDIMYLGDINNVVGDTDNIDLPDEILPEYMTLLKFKIEGEYGSIPPTEYETMLRYLVEKINLKIARKPLQGSGIRKYWFWDYGDDTVYEVLDNEVGDENLTSIGSGNYGFIV